MCKSSYLNTNTVKFVLKVPIIMYCIDRGQTTSKLITDMLEASGHLLGAHCGVYGLDNLSR